MDKELFNSLSIDEQIEFINNELAKDISFSKYMEINKDLLGIGRKGLDGRFRKHGYRLIDNQYIQVPEEVKKNNMSISASSGVRNNSINLPPETEPTKYIFTDEEVAVLKELIEERIITKSMKEVIAVQSGEYTKTSIRVDSEIWQQFLEFCKEQSLKQQEIVTIALKEFLEKYKTY